MARERLIIEVSEQGTRVVKRNIGSIGTEAEKSLQGVNLLKKALAGFVAFESIRRATRVLAGFEQQMATVRAITGATDQQFQALRRTARDLGATTRFSASQAAEGMTFLARAGFDVQESIETIDDTLRLAQAGALDLGSAADIASNVLTGFRLETDQAARVVDVLAFAANNANTDVLQLGEAMKFVAPVAAGVGVDIELAAAAIGKLSDAGLQGSLAGTGLRRVLSELESPAAKTVKLLDSLGITADQVRVSQVGLVEAMTRLRDAGVDTGLALELFGDRGGPAFEILRNAIAPLEEMEEKLDAAGGTATRISAIMDDNLNGALLSLVSAAEAVVLSLGEIGATSGLTTFIRNVASGVRFLSDNVEILTGFLSGLGILAIPKVIAGLKAISALLLANPWAVAIVAITTTIGVIRSFSDEILVSSDGITTLADVAAVTFDTISIAVEKAFDTIGAVISGLSPTLGAVFGDLDFSLRGFLDLAALVFDSFVGLVSGSIAVVTSTIEKVPAAFLGVVETVFQKIANLITDVLRFIVKGVNEVTARIQELSRELPGVTLNIPTLIAPAPPNFDSRFTDALDDLGETAGDAFNAGFEKATLGRDAVEGIFAAAEDRARQRQRTDAGANLAVPPAADVPTPNAVPTPGGNEPTGGADGQRAVSILEALNRQLEIERQNINLTGIARERDSELRRIENDLKAAGVDLGSAEGQIIFDNVEARTAELNTLQRRADLLEEIKGPEEERLLRQQDLNNLLMEGLITQEEYNQKLKESAANLNANAGVFDSFIARLEQAQDPIQALGVGLADTLTGAIDQASGAFANFIASGLSDFDSFKDGLSSIFAGIGQDILKLVVRFIILKTISAALSGIGGAIGGGVGTAISGFGDALGGGAIPGRQMGGPVRTGQTVRTGELGEELFTPTRSGNITPNSQLPGNAPVSVQVVNVENPDQAAEFLESPPGGEAVVNILGKNRRQVRQVLGIQ